MHSSPHLWPQTHRQASAHIPTLPPAPPLNELLPPARASPAPTKIEETTCLPLNAPEPLPAKTAIDTREKYWTMRVSLFQKRFEACKTRPIETSQPWPFPRQLVLALPHPQNAPPDTIRLALPRKVFELGSSKLAWISFCLYPHEKVYKSEGVSFLCVDLMWNDPQVSVKCLNKLVTTLQTSLLQLWERDSCPKIHYNVMYSNPGWRPSDTTEAPPSV